MGVKKGMVSGFLYGVTQIMMFFIFGLIFYLGIVFMVHNNLQIADVFTAVYAILFAGMTAGNNAHMMPDMGVGKKAAASIFEIIDSLDEDQLQKETGSKMVKTPIKGNIVVKNITFKYESRDQPVFTDMNLEIKEGQKVGFVGSSGCGKSTIHQLLQRFYDPNQGEIYIDGINIKDYDIHYLRSHIGVVSQ
jgi:ATP-binding cassette, subfamily B (MDR/TAP), member 1